MADEIRYTLRATLDNGSLDKKIEPGEIQVDQATKGAFEQVVVVGTSEEDMPVGDIATNGRVWVQNLDSTNFVKYGPKSAGVMVEFGRLPAGEGDWFRLAPGVTLRWIADTASVRVDMRHWEH